MIEPTIVRTETCKFLSYRDDKQTNVREVELELIAKLLPICGTRMRTRSASPWSARINPASCWRSTTPMAWFRVHSRHHCFSSGPMNSGRSNFGSRKAITCPTDATRGGLSYRSKLPISTTPTKSTSTSRQSDLHRYVNFTRRRARLSRGSLRPRRQRHTHKQRQARCRVKEPAA